MHITSSLLYVTLTFLPTTLILSLHFNFLIYSWRLTGLRVLQWAAYSVSTHCSTSLSVKFPVLTDNKKGFTLNCLHSYHMLCSAS